MKEETLQCCLMLSCCQQLVLYTKFFLYFYRFTSVFSYYGIILCTTILLNKEGTSCGAGKLGKYMKLHFCQLISFCVHLNKADLLMKSLRRLQSWTIFYKWRGNSERFCPQELIDALFNHFKLVGVYSGLESSNLKLFE